MDSLTPAQLRWLRDELGDKPDDAELQSRYDDIGSVRDVAISVLRARRAKLLSTALQTNLQGVASVNNTENVKAIERRISALALLDTDPTDEPGEEQDGAGVERVEAFQFTRSRGR